MLKAMLDFDDDEDNKEEIRDQYIYNKGRGIDTEFLKYKRTALGFSFLFMAHIIL